MKNLISFSFLLIILSSYHCWVTLAHQNFIQCLSIHSENSTTSISEIVYTQNNSSFSSILEFSLQNLRFSTLNTTQKPQVIITPFDVSQVQAVIKCSQEYGLQIRVRSGGHDYEGLSYASDVPFVIIDMLKFSEINVDAEEKTTWVQSGATLGQLYYRIAEKSKTLAFPAGTGPTVGVGGHISGGGYGFLLRKYGVAADHVVDAHLIDVKGRFLNRESMGEDLFWAIRGGGGANFGVIIAWKIKLVNVPSTVTVFKIKRTLEQNATKILHKWQHVAHKLHEDLFLSPVLKRVNSRMVALFSSLFLGGVDRLLPLVNESFPELGLTREDCTEMSWIESIIYLDRFPKKESAKLDVLLDRSSSKSFFKGKLDYVKEPISEAVLEGMYDIFYDQDEGQNAVVLFFPQGGKVNEVSESEIPYPHRAGNIYSIIYYAEWVEEGVEASQRHIDLVRKLYNYMTPYVPKNPRVATLNARDLDIGTNNNKGHTSIEEASIWGKKYFKNNFNRLVNVKSMVDPDNFFRNEQSIPPAFNLVEDERLLGTTDCEELQSFPVNINLHDHV